MIGIGVWDAPCVWNWSSSLISWKGCPLTIPFSRIWWKKISKFVRNRTLSRSLKMQRSSSLPSFKDHRRRPTWKKTLKRLIQIQVYPFACSIPTESNTFIARFTQVPDVEFVRRLVTPNQIARSSTCTKSTTRTNWPKWLERVAYKRTGNRTSTNFKNHQAQRKNRVS